MCSAKTPYPTNHMAYARHKQNYLELSLMHSGGKSTKKWSTLVHHGVIFYPDYQPHGLPILYHDQQIYLAPEAEEWITYYTHPRFDKYKTDRFNKNFFNDWKKKLTPEQRKQITNLSQCDLTQIRDHQIQQRDQKKQESDRMDKQAKEAKKQSNDQIKSRYMVAMVDGVEQTIDNFMVEPPTIFTGRGSHPLSGKIKARLRPEDIILNIGTMPVPIPYKYDPIESKLIPMDARWGSVISDNSLEWIACWQNNVTMKNNYARFGRKSGFKMRSDEAKYDLARKLKKRIKKIRAKNEANIRSSDMETRQLATALYLIDSLALRIGNEKTEDQADTVGVSTLRIKNVALLDNHIVKLDFLGKDSIRYVNKFEVPETIYANIKDFHTGKDNSQQLFDMIDSDTLNKYIKRFMKKLTSKVFRTYNASSLMQRELKKITQKYHAYDKKDKLQKIRHEYELANLKVARLANHQKVQSIGSSQQIDKTTQRTADLASKLRRLERDKDTRIAESKDTKAIGKKIGSLKQKIKELKNKKKLQTEAKTLSANTSKINYIDPRITVAFLKANGLEASIDKFFTKTHQKQFEWAMQTDAQYRF